MKRTSIAAALLLALGGAQAANVCGDLRNHYGPFDYRRSATEYSDNLRLVDGGHFNEDVENGVRGKTGSIGADLDYVLRVFPNHTRALATMLRLSAKKKSVYLTGARWPIECYFDRAVRFAPDDPAARAMYGAFLYSKGQYENALKMYKYAVELDDKNAMNVYNLGLVQLKLNQGEAANLSAQQAYALGYTLQGLKNMLVAAGKWDESVRPPAPVKPAEEDAPPAAPLPSLPVGDTIVVPQK